VLLQRGDDLWQRCDGLRAIATAIVHEHDAASPDHGAGCGFDDLRRARSAPVSGVDRPQHLTLALFGQDASNGLVGGPVRRAHASALRSMSELPTDLPRFELGQIWVVVGVVADVAALGSDLGRLSGVLGLAKAKFEERRSGVGRSQDVQDCRRVLAGSVVECQVHGAAAPRRCLALGL